MEIWRFLGVFLIQLSIQSVLSNSDPFENDQNHQLDTGEHNHSPGEPLSPQDFLNAESLVITTPPNNGHDDPMESPGVYEGDIIMSNQVLSDMLSGKNAIKNEPEKWKNGIVPYLISAEFVEGERAIIARAMLEYHRRTCIRFQPRVNQYDYIEIVKGQGCSSSVGRQGYGSQKVTLGSGCVYVGTAIHEMMHAVGFWHEQSRWDRDDYVTVYSENIIPGMEFNFHKYNWNKIQNLTQRYDTGSIMHYGPYSFSKDPKKLPTILPRNPNDRIGQRLNFSEVDVKKINILYKCNMSSGPGSSPSPNFGSTTAAPALPVLEKCSDSHEHCKKWADMGECSRNPSWMLVNCKKSCNQCDNSCSDANKHCPTWAKNGECSKNPAYMHNYCPKACKRCESNQANSQVGNESSKCEDKDLYCSAWAARGECEINPKYMRTTCPKSCNSCSATHH